MPTILNSSSKMGSERFRAAGTTRRAFLGALTALIAIHLSRRSRAMALKASEIHATVQLAVEDRIVRATVVFHNATNEKAYLYKRLVPGGRRLTMDLFRI